jgi:Mrp family chromosome partitioning ATPase
MRAVWRSRYMVLIIALLAAATGYLYESSKPPVYESVARVELRNPYDMTLFRNERGTPFTEIDRYLSSKADMVTSPDVVTRAAELLHGRVSRPVLRQSIVAQSSTKLFQLTVTARAGDPTTAADIVNASTKAFEEVADKRARQDAAGSIATLQKQEAQLRASLDELPAGDSPSDEALRTGVIGQLTAVQTRQQQIRTDAEKFGAGIEGIDQARPPEFPISDTPRRRAVIFGVLGFIAALVLAFWRGERVRLIDTDEDAAAAVNAPLLGTVPRHPADTAAAAAPVLSEPSSPAARDYGFIASTLSFAATDSERRVILVTGLEAAEATSLTALNLALSAAQDQRSTILLDVEPAGRLTTLLRATGARGASDLAALSAAGFDIGLRDGSVTPIEALEWFRFVPTGTRQLNGRDIAESPQLAKVLVQLQQEADLVFVEGPGLQERPGGLKLAAAVDGVVLVVRRGTKLEELRQTTSRLAAARAPIVGVVFDRSPAAGRWWRRRSTPQRRRRSRG